MAAADRIDIAHSSVPFIDTGFTEGSADIPKLQIP
jgi:hypothetical protein